MSKKYTGAYCYDGRAMRAMPPDEENPHAYISLEEIKTFPALKWNKDHWELIEEEGKTKK